MQEMQGDEEGKLLVDFVSYEAQAFQEVTDGNFFVPSYSISVTSVYSFENS